MFFFWGGELFLGENDIYKEIKDTEIDSLKSFYAYYSFGRLLHIPLGKCLGLKVFVMAHLNRAKDTAAHISYLVLVSHGLPNRCTCVGTVRIY